MVFWVGNTTVWDAEDTDSLNCKGYSGVGTDGQYIYYTPYYNGSSPHGVVLRQKIYAEFKDEDTWEAYNAGSVDGLTTTGFFGSPIFDGRYMYFVPNNNGSASGIVLRYDTTQPFKSAGSWDAVNLSSIYVVGGDLALWRNTYGTWTQMSSHQITKVSIGADGTIGAVDNSTGEGLIWSPDTSSWISIGGSLKDIAVFSSTAIYVIGSDDNLWFYDGSWSLFASGPFISLSVSYDGCPAVVASTGAPYIYVNSSWISLGGVLKEITAYWSNEVYGIGGDDHLWRNLDGDWTNPENTTAITHLSISKEGEMYVTRASDSAAMFFDGSTYSGATGVCLDISCAHSRHYACGFRGAVFDGQYIYFVPYNNGDYDGVVLRYDTTQPFSSPDSWLTYDLGSMASGAAKGYWGAVIVENFIYFSPYHNTSAYHGQILRYDRNQSFQSAGAWTVFDAATVSANCKGLGAPCSDGRFVYFPNATYNLVLRYDTTLPFTDTDSYATYDSTLLSEDADDQHNACCVQGQYITFAPSLYTILVYDTEKPFSDSGSWAERDVFYADDMNTVGFLGTYADPNYIYFAPSNWGSSYHGKVMRVRVNPCPTQSMPAPGDSEDLTEYMAYNPSVLSVTTHRATAIGIDASCAAYCFQDYEKDCFDAFEIWFELKLASVSDIYQSPDPEPTYLVAWSLSNKHSEILEGMGSNDPSAIISIEWDDEGNVVSQKLHLAKNESLSAGYSISTGTVYYCKASRTAGSATITLQIYSDEERTTLLSTQQITTFSTTIKWRFLYVLRGILDPENIAMATWYTEDLIVVSYS